MKTKTVNIYSFEELNESAKERAINNYRESDIMSYDWYDFVYEDAKEIGKIMGIDIDKIYFSGFWSQGDGACFEGGYCYAKGSTKKIREYAPLDKDLHAIADKLYAIQKERFYKISARVKHSGYYYHSGCTDIEVYHDSYELWYNVDYDFIDGIQETLRDFMQWIYKTLESEYEFLTSNEAIEENIKANEFEFDEFGNMV